MDETKKKLETKRIIIYLGITFLLTFGYCFGILYPLVNSDNASQKVGNYATLLIAVVMFFPAIGVLLTRLITKEGFKNAWLKLNLKGNIRTYLFAYFGPGVLTVLGMVVYFLIFPSELDLEFGYLKSALEAAGASADAYPMPMFVVFIVQAGTALFWGPIMNCITCFGEEWGWRGYLLPKMAEKLSPIPMLLINGVIWGLWHAPLTAIGHNYGIGYPGFPFTGIAMMCFFCIVMGIFLSYVTMKTKSCIPAVLGHGAINSIAGLGLYCTVDGGNPFVGPTPTGIVGIIPFIVAAVLMLVFYFGKTKKEESNSSEEKVIESVQ